MKTKTSDGLTKSAALLDGTSLPFAYWLGFALIVCTGLAAAIWLPYKDYCLDFGNYGKAPLKVARFSGAQLIRLNGDWHQLSGAVADPRVFERISLEIGETEKTPGGVKLRLVLKNPTTWLIRQLIIGSFEHGDLSHRAITLVDCNIRAHSVGEVPVSLGHDTDPSYLQLLAVVGQAQ